MNANVVPIIEVEKQYIQTNKDFLQYQLFDIVGFNKNIKELAGSLIESLDEIDKIWQTNVDHTSKIKSLAQDLEAITVPSDFLGTIEKYNIV